MIDIASNFSIHQESPVYVGALSFSSVSLRTPFCRDAVIQAPPFCRENLVSLYNLRGHDPTRVISRGIVYIYICVCVCVCVGYDNYDNLQLTVVICCHQILAEASGDVFHVSQQSGHVMPLRRLTRHTSCATQQV